jgi:hypothetical protein
MINIIREELGYDRFGIGMANQKARRVIGVSSVASDRWEPDSKFVLWNSVPTENQTLEDS